MCSSQSGGLGRQAGRHAPTFGFLAIWTDVKFPPCPTVHLHVWYISWKLRHGNEVQSFAAKRSLVHHDRPSWLLQLLPPLLPLPPFLPPPRQFCTDQRIRDLMRPVRSKQFHRLIAASWRLNVNSFADLENVWVKKSVGQYISGLPTRSPDKIYTRCTLFCNFALAKILAKCRKTRR